jgi:hypothetical protein
MLLNVYSVFDVKAKAFAVPFFLNHHGLALRAFGDCVADSTTMLNKHPEDYMLYNLGEYDDNSGKLIPLDMPEYMAKAVDFVDYSSGKGGV